MEEDDHCLYLVYKGKRVAAFSGTGATVEAIRETADRIAETEKPNKSTKGRLEGREAER